MEMDPSDRYDIPDEKTYVNVIGITEVLEDYVHHLRLTVMDGPNLGVAGCQFTLRRDEAQLLARTIYDLLEEPTEEGPI